MPYWQLFYHAVWATKDREPLLTTRVAEAVYGHVLSKATGLGGVVYAIGGVEDHVHLVVAIPPSVAVARFIGQVKGVSSAQANSSGVCDSRFSWQASYGVFSFDAKRVPNYVSYVKRQIEHHRADTTIPILERTRLETASPHVVREPQGDYAAAQDTWRAELNPIGASLPAD